MRKSDRDGGYKEICNDDYLSGMIKGSEEEDFGNLDGNNRSFRHYYDPDSTRPKKGVEYHLYYKVWELVDPPVGLERASSGEWGPKDEGVEVTKPSGGYYDGALEWARNSGGAEDLINWEGAIYLYDYTASSRRKAYEYLGHVSHLVSDMAEPDHVFNLPHPGSSYKWVSNNYGFEALVEKYIGSIDISGNSIKRRDSFDDYFNEMARRSKKAVSGKFDLPLGLSSLPGSGIYIIPDIDDDEEEDRERFLGLACGLLSYSADLNAGLLMDFYDIVNQPPYLKRIVITQGGEVILEDSCRDIPSGVITEGSLKPEDKYTRISSRMPESRKSGILKADKEAVILLEFGASGVEVPERIDPGSVEAVIGEVKVDGWQKKDDRTFEARFVPELKAGSVEKTADIKIRARDLDRHYPRKDLPAEGYELDSNPYTVARVGYSQPPYDWRGYTPGPDENHFVNIRSDSLPAILESVSVSSGNTYYLNQRWAIDDARKQAELVVIEPLNSSGVNTAEVKSGSLRLTFSREMDDATIKVRFGQQDIPMKKVSERTYEGLIRFSEFQDKHLSEVIPFYISARDKDGIAIDGDPATACFIDEALKEWRNYDDSQDSSNRLRVYHESTGKPLIRGRIYLQKDGGDFAMDIQKVYTHGKILIPGGYMPKETGVVPAPGGYNVLWYIQFIEVADKKLFDAYKRLMRTRLDILNRPQTGPTKLISRREYKDCLELLAMKEGIKSAAACKSGSLPGWLTATDKDGFFDIPIEKYPGRENVIFLLLHVICTPPFGEMSPYFSLEGTSFSNAAYSLGSLGFNVVTESHVPAELLKDAPDPDALIKLRQRVPQAEKELEDLLQQIKDMENNLKLPEHIEKRWQERAVKDQRALEAEYIRKHGPAKGWKDETRKEFEIALYEEPRKSRLSWEKDFAAFKEEHNKAVGSLKDKAARLRQEIEESQHRIRQSAKDKMAWEAKLKDAIGDISFIMMRYRDGGPQFLYTLGQTFSGSQMTAPIEENFNAKVHLIKQTIDEKWRERPVYGICSANGREGISANLKDPRDPRPPFIFDFKEPLGPHLVLNIFTHLVTSPSFVNVQEVRTMAEHLGNPATYKSVIDKLWDNYVELPGNIEVEGYPIKDSALLQELEAELKEYDEINRKASNDYLDLAKARKAGQLSREEALKKYNELAIAFARKMLGFFEALNKIKAKNPAFNKDVQEKVLGRKMPVEQKTQERKPVISAQSMPALPAATPSFNPQMLKQQMPPVNPPALDPRMKEAGNAKVKKHIMQMEERKKQLMEQKRKLLSDPGEDKQSVDFQVQAIDSQIQHLDSQIEMLNRML